MNNFSVASGRDYAVSHDGLIVTVFHELPIKKRFQFSLAQLIVVYLIVSILLGIVCCSLSASDTFYSFEGKWPKFAKESARRAFNEIQRASTQLRFVESESATIHLHWEKQSMLGILYGWTVDQDIHINAHDYHWPLPQIALDRVFLHEIMIALGFQDGTEDSVLEIPLYEHLTKQDVSLILTKYGK